jgi:hypothetical protein
MAKSLRRTAGIASVAALGLGLSLAVPANAAQLDPDPPFNPSVVSPTSVTRLAGPDRISTSIVASQSRNWGCDVIVARQDEFPDALAAGPLADVVNAPILLIPSAAQEEEVPEIVLTELRRLARDDDQWYGRYGLCLRTQKEIDTQVVSVNGGPKRLGITVHIIGGTGVISEDQQEQIDDVRGVWDTVRWRGADRYQTAVAVADAVIDIVGRYSQGGPPWFTPPTQINAFLTTGTNFPDALAAGASAAQNDGVVLLTKGEEVEKFTEEFVENLAQVIVDGRRNNPEIITVGGPADRAAVARGFSVDQSYVGATRYETAALLARAPFWGTPTLRYPFDAVGVASGESFADAVVGGGYMANADGPLLLTRPNELPAASSDYLEDYSFTLDYAFLFGGKATISNAVASQMSAALSWTS